MVHATSVSAALTRGRQPESGLIQLAQQVRCWASCLLLGLGLWLLVRRFGGALVQPLDVTGSIAAGLCFALAAASKESAAAWLLLIAIHRLLPIPIAGAESLATARAVSAQGAANVERAAGTYASLARRGRLLRRPTCDGK